MSNQGPTANSNVQAFRAMPAGSKGSGSNLVQLGLMAVGGAMVVLAAATATISNGGIAKVSDLLARLGFDKGPLAAFGLSFLATGFALAAIERARRAAATASDAALATTESVGELDGQTAILGSVQAELGALRNEIAEARRESAEQRDAEKDNANEQASDPIFRLAASLDQLGAQIDKRVDKARRETLDSIQGIASSMEVGAQQSEEASSRSASELNAIRMDVADVRGQMTRIAQELDAAKSAIETAVEEMRAAAPAAPEVVEAPKVVEEPEAVAPALPRELDDVEDATGSLEAQEPIEAPSAIEAPEEAPAAEPSEQMEAPESIALPDPPAPIPAPMPAPANETNEVKDDGLSLIDDMEEDTAKLADLTPPLFPELGNPGDIG